MLIPLLRAYAGLTIVIQVVYAHHLVAARVYDLGRRVLMG